MTIKQCEEWVAANRDTFFDMVRIYLGVGLIVKGVYFLMHQDLLNQMAAAAGNSLISSAAPFVPYVHLVGGLLLAAGVVTRLAAAAQVPILCGAVFLIHLPRMMGLEGRESVEFSALVLFLMVLIVLRGSGRLSVMGHRAGTQAGANTVQGWVAAHDDVFMDAVRIYLGVGLFIKGLLFMENRDYLLKMMQDSGNLVLAPIILVHYVIAAHLAGGILLALGLITRLWAAVQLPALVGAVVFVSLPKYLQLEQRQDLEFSTLVLFLLVLVCAHGSGRLSIDHWLHKSAQAQMEPRHAA